MPITKKGGVSHSLSQSMIFYIPPRATLDHSKSLGIHLVRKLKGWSLGSVGKFLRLLKNFLIQEERGWDGENDQTIRSNICVCVLCVFVCVFGRWGWKGLPLLRSHDPFRTRLTVLWHNKAYVSEGSSQQPPSECTRASTSLSDISERRSLLALVLSLCG